MIKITDVDYIHVCSSCEAETKIIKELDFSNQSLVMILPNESK